LFLMLAPITEDILHFVQSDSSNCIQIIISEYANEYDFLFINSEKILTLCMIHVLSDRRMTVSKKSIASSKHPIKLEHAYRV
jgi:hypothetical protein